MKPSKEEDLYTLVHSPLFQGISGKDLEEALTFLGAMEKHYKKNSMVFLIGDPMRYAGVVLEGTLELSFLDEGDNCVNMNHFSVGSTFGESLACTESERSPVQMQALTDCRILFLDLKRIVKAQYLEPGYPFQLGSNLLKAFALQNVFLNQKVRIMSQKRLRDRLRVFLRQQEKNERGEIHLSFNRNQLAEFLGVNRSALSRELGVMQEEGILAVEGNCFRILKESFFLS